MRYPTAGILVALAIGLAACGEKQSATTPEPTPIITDTMVDGEIDTSLNNGTGERAPPAGSAVDAARGDAASVNRSDDQ